MADKVGKLNRREALLTAGAVLLPAGSASAANTATIAAGLLHGRDAITISNNRLSLSVLPGGGYIGDVHLVSADPLANFNPLRVPEYQTMDPYKFDPVRDGAKYGLGIQRQVMSGYMGHFTCFPQFGGSQSEFERNGYGNHGELIISKWERLASESPHELLIAAHLPINQYNFRRSITMLPDESVAYVKETAENLTEFERPCQWVQHVTMGPPFAQVGKLRVDGSVGYTLSGKGGAGTQLPWPQYDQGGHGNILDARIFSGQSAVWLMQRAKRQNWLAAYHPDFNVIFGHVYDARLNPWVLDWQSNGHRDGFPVPGNVVARGLCWGDSPVASGIKAAVTEGLLTEVPNFSWMEPLAQRSQDYVIFMAEIPRGWRGTADIVAADGTVQIFEIGNGQTIRLKAGGFSAPA
jgi:hypothetical protein